MCCSLANSVNAGIGYQSQENTKFNTLLEEAAGEFYLRLKKYADNVSSMAKPSRREEILDKNLAWVNDYYQRVVLELRKIWDSLTEIVSSIYPALGVPAVVAEGLILERFFNVAFLKYLYCETKSFELVLEYNHVNTLLFHLATSERYEKLNEVEEKELVHLLFLLGREAFTALMLRGKLDSKDFCGKALNAIYAIYGGDFKQAIKKRTDLLGSVVLDILQHDPESAISVLEKVASSVKILRGSDIYQEHPLLFLKVCFEKSARDGTPTRPMEWINAYEELCREKLTSILEHELVAALWNGLSALILFSDKSFSPEQVLLIFKKDLKAYAKGEGNGNPKPCVSIFDQVRNDILQGEVFNIDYEPEAPEKAGVKAPIPL